MVAVGYMDPGNWATSLAGGSKFGYTLLVVALISNIMAIILQSLCARLAIATGKDLAQACRDAFPRWLSWPLWALAELAICATDLAEVIGTAIGLNLIFGIPLEIGVFKDDQRRVAAKLHRAFLNILGRLPQENSAHFGRAGEGHFAHERILREFAPDRRGTGGVVELFSDRNVFPLRVAERIRNALERFSIGLRADTPVDAIESGPVVVSPAGRERFDAVFWTAGAAAPPMLRESGLMTDERGFVNVDPSLRSVSHPDVFAAGDTASLFGAVLPKSGVYAVRQAPVLAENLKRVVRGMPMLDYVPQSASLSLISCGAKYAIASRGGWSAEGAWAWRWKDWLDRRWIARFR